MSKEQLVSLIGGAVAAVGAGFIILRLMKHQIDEDVAEEAYYETKKLLNEYLMMHFGEPKELVRIAVGRPSNDSLSFPLQCALKCIEVARGAAGIPSRALDVGCAVGRSTFEMARFFDEVIGIDFSQSFINAANELKDKGKLDYTIVEEGDITSNHTASIDISIDRKKVKFFQGDACNLKADLKGFGVVLAANLVCRLPDPILFLNRLKSLVVKGGFVVMPSPYTWLESFTKKSKWIGGYYDDKGNPVYTVDEFKRILGSDFDLVESSDMPFFIRETGRKNQWTVSHLTVWRKK